MAQHTARACRIARHGLLAAMLFVGGTAFSATAVYEVPLAPLGQGYNDQVTATINLDIGGQARLTGPIRVHSDIYAEFAHVRCDFCSGPIRPECVDHQVAAMKLNVETSLGGEWVRVGWTQVTNGPITLDMVVPLPENPESAIISGTECINVVGERALFGYGALCNEMAGIFSFRFPGVLQFPNGMTISVEYEPIVPTHRDAWGSLKARYR